MPDLKEVPTLEKRLSNTKRIIEAYQMSPRIRISYEIAPNVSVEFQNATAFEHRMFMGWLVKDMPGEIRMKSRQDFEAGSDAQQYKAQTSEDDVI